MEQPRTAAVIGTGIMGSAMAANLLRAGVRTVVWDRDPSASDRLAHVGAERADSARDAAARAEVVITMLPTAEVVRNVVLDTDVVDSFQNGAVWAQMGTIGIEATERIADEIAERRPDVLFVDAPVSGSKAPAEAGELLILASGPTGASPLLEPIFSAIGRKAVWLGIAGQGTKLKLVINSYLCTLIEDVAETLALADQLGVDRKALEDAIEGGPLDAPLADAKLHKMESGDYAAEFPLEWAVKDVDLAVSAATGQLPLLSAVSTQWHEAVKAGHGREDISAARLALN